MSYAPRERRGADWANTSQETLMANPNTRMNNRKAPDTVGRPHDDGHKAAQQPAQGHASLKDTTAAIEAAEHGKDAAHEAPDTKDRH